MLSRLSFAWIEPKVIGFVIAVTLDQFGVGFADMGIRLGVFLPGVASSVGVEPSMKLHPATVGFFNPELERIVPRLWCFALLTRQVVTPGFELACIERIARGSDLEYDRIEMHLMALIENRDGLSFLLLDAEPWASRPIDIGDRSNPYPSEFSRDFWQRAKRGGLLRRADGTQGVPKHCSVQEDKGYLWSLMHRLH